MKKMEEEEARLIEKLKRSQEKQCKAYKSIEAALEFKAEVSLEAPVEALE